MCTNLLRKQSRENFQEKVSARTMDFGTITKPFPVTLKPNMVIYPRKREFPIRSSFIEKLEEDFRLFPQKPLNWTNKYGFAAIDVGPCIFNEIPFKVESISPIFLDGVNEKGLSAASLWLSGSQYQKESVSGNNLMFLDVVGYVLGMCATVSEVKSTLSTINVVCPSKFLMNYPAHYIFIDSDVDSPALVVEYTNGSPSFYEVPNGVLTNEPAYPEMLKKLDKYKSLTVYQKKPNDLPGLFDLPADSSAISRFVRATKFVESIYAPEDIQKSISLSDVIIQNIQVPLGTVVEETSNRILDYTQWSVLRDHLNLVYYYKTFDNQALKKLDLTLIDFEVTDIVSIPISTGEWNINETKKYTSPKKSSEYSSF
ncbi:linear amide C-N hydrolase [Aquimarina sp. 2201CG1-2-11]|uniref:linear amide C-N hydrolase n=1 Tax=Aquimarina discodermiae TaxID=3231043 RepID=UPI0034636224